MQRRIVQTDDAWIETTVGFASTFLPFVASSKPMMRGLKRKKDETKLLKVGRIVQTGDAWIETGKWSRVLSLVLRRIVQTGDAWIETSVEFSLCK